VIWACFSLGSSAKWADEEVGTSDTGAAEGMSTGLEKFECRDCFVAQSANGND